MDPRPLTITLMDLFPKKNKFDRFQLNNQNLFTYKFEKRFYVLKLDTSGLLLGAPFTLPIVEGVVFINHAKNVIFVSSYYEMPLPAVSRLGTAFFQKDFTDVSYTHLYSNLEILNLIRIPHKALFLFLNVFQGLSCRLFILLW